MKHKQKVHLSAIRKHTLHVACANRHVFLNHIAGEGPSLPRSSMQHDCSGPFHALTSPCPSDPASFLAAGRLHAPCPESLALPWPKCSSVWGWHLLAVLAEGLAVCCLPQWHQHLMPIGPLHQCPQLKSFHFHFILYLTVWGVEPVATRQTSWLESTGVCGVQV